MVALLCNFMAHADRVAELTLKHTGLQHSNGIQRDIKIIVKQGNFPIDGGDIIVNDAKPSLLGFMDTNGSPTDKAVFEQAGGGLEREKREIDILS